jgi:hypothetical protein
VQLSFFVWERIFIMMMTWLIIFAIIIAVLLSLSIADDPCRFEDPSKGVLDLTSSGRTDGKAAYPDVAPSTGSNYSTFVSFLSCYLLLYIS